MDTLLSVAKVVEEAGKIGIMFQKRLRYEDRNYKDDGSVVTDADRTIEEFLCTKIGELIPGSCFVRKNDNEYFMKRRSSLLLWIQSMVRTTSATGCITGASLLEFWTRIFGLLEVLFSPLDSISSCLRIWESRHDWVR